MNQIIAPKSINFKELVQNANTTLSLNIQTKMINILNEEFSEEEQQWYIANLYIYMHYHPTNDYPINLEDVFKMIGFANKRNAKRTLDNNFIIYEDYKITVLHSEHGQFAREEIKLNVDTFKNLCMLAKTDKGREIRKYYIKLENIYNKIIQEEIEQQHILLRQKDEQLLEKDEESKRKVENTLRDSFNKRSVVYLIKILIDDEIIYKFGYTDDIVTRLRTHKNQIGEDIELIYCIESKDNKMLERLFVEYLEQYNFRIKRTINDKQQTELLKVNDIEMIKNKLKELNKDVENEQLLIMTLKNKIIDLENENIELKKQLHNNEYINYLKNKIENLEKTINDMNEQKSSVGNETIETIENEDTINDRIFKKRKVDKIDPTTLNILETYECINAILVKNKEEKYSYNGIYKSIKKNNVYKNFRWNYHGEVINPTNNITRESSKVERVVQLDKNKNFVKSFKTKSELCKILHIGIIKLNKYINDGKILNDFYYINESSYDGDILDEEKYVIHNSKPIRETNIETNETVIYISMQELYEKRGISRQTLRNCIKNDKVCDKFKWEYVNDDHNKNNNKKVKEINIENHTFTEFKSMKEAYTKLNITLGKLRAIIANQTIINKCIYEFY
jgi:phage anti-repressor protein